MDPDIMGQLIHRFYFFEFVEPKRILNEDEALLKRNLIVSLGWYTKILAKRLEAQHNAEFGNDKDNEPPETPSSPKTK